MPLRVLLPAVVQQLGLPPFGVNSLPIIYSLHWNGRRLPLGQSLSDVGVVSGATITVSSRPYTDLIHEIFDSQSELRSMLLAITRRG